jgi:hypothetical protein
MRAVAIVVLASVIVACGQPAAPGGEAAAQGASGGGGQAAFVERCIGEMVAQNPESRRWAPEECGQNWERVVAAGPMADAILAAAGGTMPSPGRMGRDLDVTVDGAARSVSFGWSQTGAIIPYDVVGALRERFADVAMIGCGQYGVGEFSKAYRVTPRGGAAFQLGIYDRMAPTANAESFYNVTATLNGRVMTRAQLAASDGMEWTERCAY